MEDSSKSLCHYLQKLLKYLPKEERRRRIWDETFTYVHILYTHNN